MGAKKKYHKEHLAQDTHAPIRSHHKQSRYPQILLQAASPKIAVERIWGAAQKQMIKVFL